MQVASYLHWTGGCPQRDVLGAESTFAVAQRVRSAPQLLAEFRGVPDGYRLRLFGQE